MTLAPLPDALLGNEAMASLLGRRSVVLAVADPARPFAIAALSRVTGRRPIVVVTPTGQDAERVAYDLRAYLGDHEVDTFPAWETLPFERVSPGIETMGRRVQAMVDLVHPERRPAVLVAPVKAMLQRLGPHVEESAPVIIRPGDTIDPQELVARLVGLGYQREYQVEHRGEVAVRGSIVDVFAATADVPVRIDLWGDEVERLAQFSVHDQRTIGDVGVVEVLPCRELRPTDDVRQRAAELIAQEPWGREQWERLAQGQFFEGMESWLPWLVDDERVLGDLLPDDALVLLIEPRRMRDRAEELVGEEHSLASSLAVTWQIETGSFPRLHLAFDRLLARCNAPVWTVSSVAEGPETVSLRTEGWQPVSGDHRALLAQVSRLLGEKYRVIVATDGEGSAERIARVLREEGFVLKVLAPGVEPDMRSPASAGILQIVVQPIERGFILPSGKIAVLGEADLTGRRRAHRRAKTRKREASHGFFDDLKPGDYIVHHQHGVGRFSGMVKRAIGGVDRDYLLLEYKGDDKLYVPSDQIDLIRPYTGEAPSLHKLGGKDWGQTKARIRQEVKKVAQELVVLYQRRISAPGHAFGGDTPWQMELEEAFPFVETPDQLKAINDVKADMESPAPMDRVVVGDVGFGKTEVAIRAAFKAVQDGKQVAVLVPTTLLANQHFQTFSDRFAGYPVRVEVLSRFLTPAQSKKVIDGVKDGEVDVIIGTHRLLQNNLKFPRLGLLVVDEEQRFGVTHKEAIKQLKTDVDVLTMTATPIPRTMEMALTGIRDLSVLNTPPADRQPILTYVGTYDDRAVAEAIRRELLREGQVFFVHNRVVDIELVADQLRTLVPEARIAVAHGQMDEAALEQIVYDFAEGSFDVLVCTTIIETGIDMPTVNTLVVDRADRLGLGQLHQLRGRVGRSGQRAYAYLFTPPDMQLSEEAYERLKTIGEHTELGSGFKIAMRDLEIRGAGSLLGGDQSGHIAAVGYDLYSQMVIEAVGELKGEPVREPAEIKLEVPIDANIPHDYISKEPLRLEAYRRLAAVTTQSEVDDIEREWADRYGPVPARANALLDVARLRAECHRIGLRDVTVTKGGAGASMMLPGALQARLQPIDLKTSQEIRLQRLSKTALWKRTDKVLLLPMKPGGSSGPSVTESLLVFLDGLFPPEPGERSGVSRVASGDPRK